MLGRTDLEGVAKQLAHVKTSGVALERSSYDEGGVSAQSIASSILTLRFDVHAPSRY